MSKSALFLALFGILRDAIKYQSLKSVKYLVDNGADIHCEDESGKTALHYAVHAGGTAIVKYFVEQCGADVNRKDTNGLTVLQDAVTECTLDIVEYLVEKGADVNGKKNDGWTVLHYAVRRGRLEVVKFLVKKGAEVNGKGTNKVGTALHIAVTKDTPEIAEYLIEKRADVNDSDSDGWTVLHSACTEGTLEMVKYLVAEGARVNAMMSNGKTGLHYAVSRGKLEIVKCLVYNGADLNSKATYETRVRGTVLHHAIVNGGINGNDKLKIVKYLVEHGADVNANDSLGWTVLHAAVDVGELDIVKYLVEQGADITLQSKRSVHTLGIDILEMAVVTNSIALVNLLLEKSIAVWRAGTFLVEGRQMSLLEWSIQFGHEIATNRCKGSVKHREKIQELKAMNRNELKETETLMQAFVAKSQFKIGEGARSSVYVGVMKDKSDVAVKRILVQSEDTAVENEKKIMSLIKTDNSPFIVSYRHFHRDDTFMYLIVDLCEETLSELVQACSIEYLKQRGPQMIREILSRLEFLHGKGILHRDLKPANVLVDIEGRMKLADFGISRVLNDGETTVETFAKGTRGWMPPEVIEAIDKDEKGRFKKKSDVHVAGMIAFFILTKGEHPFGSNLDRMRNILEDNPVYLEKLSDDRARTFVSWLINHKIEDRPYAHEALGDSFVMNGDLDNLVQRKITGR
ncbi:serine/threonine-protein phosphatase 6 regulatory ankyrin repeat subunit C-like [Dendronephthya gigantea]|uniref:serine/threonine-protein phosphatase 6 regulatory ankyrin repeat subunit C-like n=1 Tax=Dendronephthya gigantea TaxID=151771 RepID=UPI00106B1CB2|nr:serine/threonine-protein phosphatase 6 regulatory ankyrin repeat subunit C-like [Dendronephthya gigantea]